MDKHSQAWEIQRERENGGKKSQANYTLENKIKAISNKRFAWSKDVPSFTNTNVLQRVLMMLTLLRLLKNNNINSEGRIDYHCNFFLACRNRFSHGFNPGILIFF